MSEKKFFLVTDEWMKWAFNHGAQYAVTADCPPNYPEELPPGARVLTREQVEKAIGCPADVKYMRGVLDELFGEGE